MHTDIFSSDTAYNLLAAPTVPKTDSRQQNVDLNRANKIIFEFYMF